MSIAFKVVFDSGKPYEEEFKDIDALKIGLKAFYEQNEGTGYPFDSQVYLIENGEETDITETQLINEIVGDIIGCKDE